MRTLIILLALGASLAGAAAAHGAVGALTYQGCLADTGAEGCVDLPSDPLQQASAVTPSPDGRSVYVAGYAGDSIAHLFRTPASGALSLDGCLNGNGSQNCGDLFGSPLDGASDVAVTPDGRSVYVTSFGADAIAHFFRSPTGQLFYDGCLANAATGATEGCVDLPGDPLDGASAVAVSPDGASVYVGATTLARFAANGPEGQITYTGCLNNDGSESCVDLPGEPLEGVNDVAVSPDGKSVYAASFTSDAVANLLRTSSTGALAWDGCLNNDGSDGCENAPGSPLDGALGLALSPDGRSLYVASGVGDSISQLARNPATGQLGWEGCLNNEGTDNCVDVPGAPLDYAAGVAASPDGRSVYVAAYDGDAVAHLVRDPRDGRLTWSGCLADTGAEGCADVPSAPLDGAQDVAVSPDGSSVLVATAFSSSVVRFARELPAPPAPPAPGPTPAPDRVAPAISRVTLTKRRLRRTTTVRFTLSEPAAVRVAIQRGRRVRRTVERPGAAGANRVRIARGALRPGAYRARLVAVDAAGNRSAPVTVRFRVIRR
jgi:DNA-binding beta-propeller fold protein YncE